MLSYIKEHPRLTVCEKMELRRIFGFKRGALIANLMELHNEMLHTLYCLPDIVKVIDE